MNDTNREDGQFWSQNEANNFQVTKTERKLEDSFIKDPQMSFYATQRIEQRRLAQAKSQSTWENRIQTWKRIG